MQIQPTSASQIPTFQEPIRTGSSSTTWKVHARVVLSYALIGIGLALAVASIYMATVLPPMIAMATPILPLALGILVQPEGTLSLISSNKAGVYLKGQPLGLRNPNVNCWLNSAFQLINNTKSYKELLKEVDEEANSSAVSKLTSYFNLFSLLKHCKNYQAELNRESGQTISSEDTQEVRKWLANVKSEIPKEGTQEDPIALFEELHSRSGKYLPLMQQKNNEKPLSRNRICIDLDFNAEGAKSFSKLFNAFFDEHIQDSKIHLKKWFTDAPKGFLVQVTRYAWQADGTQEKITRDLNVPMSLTLTEAQCKSGNRKYTPEAFIVQHGSTIAAGHYTAYVRRNGYWWHANDSHITQVSDREAARAIKQAYLVHYGQLS